MDLEEFLGLSNYTIPEDFRFIHILNINKQRNPYNTAVTYPNSHGAYENLNYLELYNIVKRQASCMSNLKGRYVGVIIDNNVESLVTILALMIANKIPFLLSYRNSITSLLSLIDQVGCLEILYSKCYERLASQCLINKTMISIDLSNKDDIQNTFEDIIYSNDSINIVIHSSGSTSMPKIVKLRGINIIISIIRGELWQDKKVADKCRILGYAPLFHIYGLIIGVFSALYYGDEYCFPIESRTPSIASIIRGLSLNPTICMLLPSIIEDFALHCNKNQHHWKLLSNVKAVLYGGAKLSPNTIELCIKNGVNLKSNYGSSECGCLAGTPFTNGHYPTIMKLKTGVRHSFEKIENYHELVICDDINMSHGISGIYRTGDMFILSQEGIEYIGRIDDLLVHSTGEKTLAFPIEESISQSPYIESCILIGTDRPCCALLIQLKSDHKDEVLNHIELVNKKFPTHSRLFSNMIHFIDNNKCFSVTAKGNVNRIKSIEMFILEIEALYSGLQKDRICEIKKYSKDEINEIISDALISLFDSVDFALDSLTSVQLKNKLNIKGIEVTLSDIYRCNNFLDLSRFIYEKQEGYTEDLNEAQEKLDLMISKYTKFESKVQNIKDKEIIYFLTGSTGSLGAFILRDLEKKTNNTIYLLIRAEDDISASIRLYKNLEMRLLGHHKSDRIIPLKSDLTKPDLGLEQNVLVLFSTNPVCIIHNGWTMNFMYTLYNFDSCLKATYNLLNLAMQNSHSKFVFISSIGAAFPVSQDSNIKEHQLSKTLTNLSTCNGYNLSKLATEKIVEEWHRQCGNKFQIIRVGQVAGDTINGIWNSTEMLPILFKASKMFSIFPDTFMSLDWIPIDFASSAIVDATNKDQEYFHIINPNHTDWEILMGFMIEKYKVKLCPMKSFLDKLSKFVSNDGMEFGPLLEYLTNSVNYIHIKLETASSFQLDGVKNSPKIDSLLLNKYFNFWENTGFL